MVGRALKTFHLEKRPPGKVVLQVENLSYVDEQGVTGLQGLNFQLHAGEILGVAGVSGNGQSELLHLLAGLLKPSRGRIIYFDNQLVVDAQQGTNPQALHQLGVNHLAEDRHKEAMVAEMTAWENFYLGYTQQMTASFGQLEEKKAKETTQKAMESYDIRPAEASWPMGGFSGGNQQKLVFTREMTRSPKIFLLGQPTRGVDVGAIETIHEQILHLRAQGVAILLVSVELDEIMTLSDRILVLHQGQATGLVDRDQADRQNLGLMMAGKLHQEVA